MEPIPAPDLGALLARTLEPRISFLKDNHRGAVRLFNGFTEGYPALVVDLYGRTLLLLTHKVSERESYRLSEVAADHYRTALTGIDCVILKQRSSSDPEKKRGMVIYGSEPETSLLENGVSYALDLLMNQDAGFYIDTRNLRIWLQTHSEGKTVLNTFAYTGSLGVAVLAGGAARVTQIDRSGKFLALAKRSVSLSGFDTRRMECSAVDFFVGVGQMKRAGQSFDTVILDPPFFSITERGRVDQVNEATRLVNKARPLVNDSGYLVVVNNALFLSGKDFIDALEAMGRDGYVSIEELIPVPEDVTGYPQTRTGRLPVDPAPFNHSTKIVVLKVRKKQA
jgi:23S rRNA (cytosine1962-C5)-methyltransferase